MKFYRLGKKYSKINRVENDSSQGLETPGSSQDNLGGGVYDVKAIFIVTLRYSLVVSFIPL